MHATLSLPFRAWDVVAARMSKFYFHIRTQDSFDRDYEGVDIQAQDGMARAVAIALRMVSELVANNEPIDGLTFEIRDSEDRLVAELPFQACTQLQ